MLPKIKLRRPQDFFDSSTPCTAVEETKKRIRERRAENPIDLVTLRQLQDQSYLGGQVVGAEIPEHY